MADFDSPNLTSVKDDTNCKEDGELYFVDNENWATLFRLARQDCEELVETNSVLQDKIEFYENQILSITTDYDTSVEVFNQEKSDLLCKIAVLEKANSLLQDKIGVLEQQVVTAKEVENTLSKVFDNEKSDLLCRIETSETVHHEKDEKSVSVPPLVSNDVQGSSVSNIGILPLPVNSVRKSPKHKTFTCLTCGRIGHTSTFCWDNVYGSFAHKSVGFGTNSSGFRIRGASHMKGSDSHGSPIASTSSCQTSSRKSNVFNCSSCGRDGHLASFC
ncbi:hypothetical protein FRX31_009454 [Thalictrum thalictroides]|uniref:CCHC-type domain-containing protein n=1 Tax=Thalictrum thalictroides TaxID=46969 RepID=A0A7J6WU91_THATH|nr:hypothetical protein FRX31_009454 [Thalictrum thalictroides]